MLNTFDYEIELKRPVTILTGPNGYGKTTILRLLNAVYEGDMPSVYRVPFEEIIIVLDSGNQIRLTKNGDYLEVNGMKFDIGNVLRTIENGTKTGLYFVVKGDIFHDRSRNRVLSRNSLEFELFSSLKDVKEQMENVKNMVTPTYFIRDQRLTHRDHHIVNLQGQFQLPAMDAIDEYSRELKEIVKNTYKRFTDITQKLDSSFPKRLFAQEDKIDEGTFERKRREIRDKQELLSNYGLSVSPEEDTNMEYQSENAKVLALYVQDMNEKLDVFSDILNKFQLFTNILNEKRLCYKKILISSEGLSAISDSGETIALNGLSSGEQQQIVMLYFLLFKAGLTSLVLIDEPEISLHVAWQHDFMDDLISIMGINSLNSIVATHSPQIINEHWDKVIDLYDLSKKEK